VSAVVWDAAGQPVDDAAIFVTEVQATEPLSGTRRRN
jgi:hypothetical protein